MPRSKREVDKEKMYQKIMPSLARVKDLPEEEQVDSRMASGQLQLVNLMEELVFSKLEEALERFKCCNCEHCRKDVAALALNRLQPKYVVTKDKRMELLALANQTRTAEASTALVQAILTVKANPRH